MDADATRPPGSASDLSRRHRRVSPAGPREAGSPLAVPVMPAVRVPAGARNRRRRHRGREDQGDRDHRRGQRVECRRGRMARPPRLLLEQLAEPFPDTGAPEARDGGTRPRRGAVADLQITLASASRSFRLRSANRSASRSRWKAISRAARRVPGTIHPIALSAVAVSSTKRWWRAMCPRSWSSAAASSASSSVASAPAETRILGWITPATAKTISRPPTMTLSCGPRPSTLAASRLRAALALRAVRTQPRRGKRRERLRGRTR